MITYVVALSERQQALQRRGTKTKVDEPITQVVNINVGLTFNQKLT